MVSNGIIRGLIAAKNVNTSQFLENHPGGSIGKAGKQ
jgi:hypothetical protein